MPRPEYTGRWAAAHSFVNRKLPNDAPIDVNSPQIINALCDRAFQTRHPDGQPWTGNSDYATKQWSTGIYIADADTPLVGVTVDRPLGGSGPQGTVAASIEYMFEDGVPIPDEARPAHPFPGDQHMTIYQPSTDKLWTFWKARKWEVDGPSPAAGQAAGVSDAVLNRPGWHCQYGGAMINMTKSPGYFEKYGEGPTAWPHPSNTYSVGETATKIPKAFGLIKHGEGLAAKAGTVGAIPHIIHVAPLNTSWRGYRWPARSFDGTSGNIYAPYEGMIFRLPHTYDVSTIADNFTREVARAWRDYGMIAMDAAGANSMYCEDRSTQPNTQALTTDIWYGSADVPGPGHDGVFSDWPNLLAQTLPWTSLVCLAESFRVTSPQKRRFIIQVP